MPCTTRVRCAGRVRTPDKSFISYDSILIAGLISILSFGFLAMPSRSDTAPQVALPGAFLHSVHAFPAAAYAQDAGLAAPPAAAPAAPKPVELPQGDGKPIATEFCQDCHRLTNLTKAHKNLDDWKDTVQLMMDRGANVQPEQVDTLVQYLAKNFGPKEASTPASAGPSSSTPGQ